MSIIRKTLLFLIALCFSVIAIGHENNVEKIIMIRHGEKPLIEIGQLNCQGLNRSLLLPHYFKTHFVKPDYIFAPNPSDQIDSFFSRKQYSYLRPLATIEPTAISLDMSVNAQIGYDHPKKLMNELLKSKYRDATIYVAWEHINIQKFAHLILNQFQNKAFVPSWYENNYNRVYVFTIDWNKKPATLQFGMTTEGFHHISKICPK